MATYFQARKAVKVFTEYKRLTQAYWLVQPPPNEQAWMAPDMPAPENAASRAVREKIILLFPEANTLANRLGVGVMAHSYPAPAIGGPVVTVNVLYAAVDNNEGHQPLPEQRILDTIDRCLAQAITVKNDLFRHQLINPVWWFTEIVAYVLRIPFLILRRAGVPAKVEESIWGNIFKVLFFLLMVWLSLRYGFNLTAKDILNWIK
jgi:hypothetical protein